MRHGRWSTSSDQKRGRLTLLRDLLDHLPDTASDAPAALALPPLAGKTEPESATAS